MAKNGSPGELTRRQRRAIAALLSEPNIEAAAKLAHVGERTLYRWLAECAPFRQALASAETEAINNASRRLVQLTDEALDTLQGVMASPTASDAARVSGARAVLDGLLRLRELASVELRLSALEGR